MRISCANWSLLKRHTSKNSKANNQDLQSEVRLLQGNVTQEHNQQREQALIKELEAQKTSQAVNLTQS